MGAILLAGGAEFGGQMRMPDLRALALAGGMEAPVVILPTAAAPDNNHRRAGENGVRWFRSLGARQVRVAPLIDYASALDREITGLLRQARLIYLLGGFTRHLTETLRGSPAWEAARQAWEDGAVLAGSSAGAMALCEHVFDHPTGQVIPGLNLLPNACVLPHHNRVGRHWAGAIMKMLPRVKLLGIDERTAMLNNGSEPSWHVLGQGSVTLYHEGTISTFQAGQTFIL